MRCKLTSDVGTGLELNTAQQKRDVQPWMRRRPAARFDTWRTELGWVPTHCRPGSGSLTLAGRVKFDSTLTPPLLVRQQAGRSKCQN